MANEQARSDQRRSDQPTTLALVIVLLALATGGLWLGGGPMQREATPRLLAGLAISLLMGLVAQRQGWLTPSGRLGAVLTGTLIFGGGGLVWGGVLVVFFVLSSLLSRLRRRRKESLDAAVKGSRRDLGQALANGGLGALLAVAALFWPQPALFAAFIGAMAAVTADTWSTEIGLLTHHRPRLVTTGRLVTPGTNGGVTLPGSLAGAAGGLTIGLTAFLLAALADGWGELIVAPTARLWLPLLGLLAGIGGGLIDSLLGATLQAVRRCPSCDVETERAIHRCGAPTEPLRGLPWLDNDRVNFAASAAGALLAAALWLSLAL